MSTSAIHVGMADLVAVRHPATLITLGLGSCIGLVIYDQAARVAAMAHIMLPDSRDAKEVLKPGKFADTAVPLMMDKLMELGVNKSKLKAKMAGGPRCSTSRQGELPPGGWGQERGGHHCHAGQVRGAPGGIRRGG